MTSNGATVLALVIGAVCGIGSEVLFNLSELWGPLPWIVGLVLGGSAYSTLIANAAHEQQADRRPEPPRNDGKDPPSPEA